MLAADSRAHHRPLQQVGGFKSLQAAAGWASRCVSPGKKNGEEAGCLVCHARPFWRRRRVRWISLRVTTLARPTPRSTEGGEPSGGKLCVRGCARVCVRVHVWICVCCCEPTTSPLSPFPPPPLPSPPPPLTILQHHYHHASDGSRLVSPSWQRQRSRLWLRGVWPPLPQFSSARPGGSARKKLCPTIMYLRTTVATTIMMKTTTTLTMKTRGGWQRCDVWKYQ